MATYYVNSTDGNASDSNDGLYQTYQGGTSGPWLTVGKSIVEVAIGDTVYVCGNTEASPTLYDENVILTTSGSEGNIITFSASPRRSAVIRVIGLRNRSYINIEGFRVTNDYTELASPNYKVGVYLRDCSYIEILDNHFYDLRFYPAILGHWSHSSHNITIKNNYIERCNIGIWGDGNNWLVEDNEIYRLMMGVGGVDADYARFWGIGQIWRGNYFHGTILEEVGGSHTDGFQTFKMTDDVDYYCKDILIENNIVSQMHQAILMQDYHAQQILEAPSEVFTNITIRNNVFNDIWAYGIGLLAVGDVDIYNNTFYDMVHFVARFIGPIGNIVIKNNIMANSHGDGVCIIYENMELEVIDENYNLVYNWNFGSGPGWFTNWGDGSIIGNTDAKNPDFVDAGGEDFQLQSSSPAINAGVDVEVVLDIEGNVRPQGSGYDIGAYEYAEDIDVTAPTPDPMTWAIEPTVVDNVSITMTATTAVDPSGVEYYFEEITGHPGGNDSGWQDSPVYVDSDLTELVTYTYTVKARDKSANQNETAVSEAKSATIIDLTAPTPDPMTWAIEPYDPYPYSLHPHGYRVTMTANTAVDSSGVEYRFVESSGSPRTGWPTTSDSGWISSPTWTDYGLYLDETYIYRVKARDKSDNQNETDLSASASVLIPTPDTPDVTAPTPNPMTWVVEPIAINDNSITMTATTAVDPSGVEYKFTETSGNPGGSSGDWQDSPVYVDSGLTANTKYTYTVKVRDKSDNQNETSESVARSVTTEAVSAVGAGVNTENKRRSAIGVLPFVIFPVPDGTINANDRQQASWLYCGTDPTAPPIPPVTDAICHWHMRADIWGRW